MTKKKAIIIITALICVILATGSGIGVILYKTNAKKTSGGTVMTETNAVEIDENGNLVDGATGEKLSDEEIEKLKSKGVIKESKDGKVSIDQDKNKKKAEVKADKEDKTKDDSKKDSKDKNDKSNKSSDDISKNENKTADAKKDDSSSNSSSEKKNDNGSQNNQNPQKPDPKPSDDNGNQPSTEQKNPEPSTEAPTQVCSHDWVWKTHTETVHHDAVYHEEGEWDIWDEPVYATKYQCAACGAVFDTSDQAAYHCAQSDTDQCFNWGSTQVQVDTIHHEDYINVHKVLDKEAWDEQVEVKDYQYCSKCGAKK